MTATKLIKSYLYRNGSWEDVEWANGNEINELAFDIGNGSHEDDVAICGYPLDDNTHTCGVVGSAGSSRFSAAYKWGYAHAVLYGSPRGSLDPYVAVLEIAEDACDGDEHLSPYPYAVLVNLVFNTHVVFADSFPDLIGLLNEVLPLVNPVPPTYQNLYRLHEWDKNRRVGLRR